MSREQIKKLNLKIVLIVLVIAILLVFGAFITSVIVYKPDSKLNSSHSSWFKVPGGYTVSELAKELDKAGFIDEDEFNDAAKSVDYSSFNFINKDIDKKHQLDGFLFPKTYKIDSSANAVMLITTMLDSFDNYFNDVYRARADELNMSIRDIVTLASLIEIETSIDKERAHLSGVFHNMLNLDMEFKGGYPKNPLCSPSSKSIEAALYPEESDDIYYVFSEKLDGSHVFTADKSEYKEFKKAYRLAKKEEKSQEK